MHTMNPSKNEIKPRGPNFNSLRRSTTQAWRSDGFPQYLTSDVKQHLSEEGCLDVFSFKSSRVGFRPDPNLVRT